mmetsp:Transcript_9699/g.16326  ORF Transcript_9699/g.16326 Transcript_9699/m.16326 type:complete len:422 (-) Transcript_9699:228-1493(-)
MLLQKCAQIMKKEPVIKPHVSCLMIWNLYAIGYRSDRELIDKLSKSLVSNLQLLSPQELVSCFKAFAYFGYVPEEARSGLIVQAIRSSDKLDFKSLAEICESHALICERQGYFPDKTLLTVVRNLIVKHNREDKLGKLVYKASSMFNDEVQLTHQMELMIAHRDRLSAIEDSNYLLPKQVAQFMNAFALSEYYDFELYQVLEQCLVQQMDLATGPQLVQVFGAHQRLTLNMLTEEKPKQKKRYITLFHKYNEDFLGHLVKGLSDRVQQELNLKAIIDIMERGSQSHLKKRVVIRQMREFALRGVMTLREEVDSILDHHRVQLEREGAEQTPAFEFEPIETMMINYFTLAQLYCLRLEDREALINRFNDIFIDYNRLRNELTGQDTQVARLFNIVELSKENVPLGFQYNDHSAYLDHYKQQK